MISCLIAKIGVNLRLICNYIFIMLTYTTHLKKLVLPEYGRNIQRMVDHCLTIADRDERSACARAIIAAMTVLFPPTGDKEAYQRKLWDHLAIMSDFNLDVDTPYDMTMAETMAKRPEPLPYMVCAFDNRQYGLTLQRMVDVAAEMPQGDERDALIELIAAHIKKTLSAINPEGVDDDKVFKDLRMMSHGAINIAPGQIVLPEFQIIAPATGKKKKKKK